MRLQYFVKVLKCICLFGVLPRSCFGSELNAESFIWVEADIAGDIIHYLHGSYSGLRFFRKGPSLAALFSMNSMQNSEDSTEL